MSKSYHKKTTGLEKPFDYPVIKWGYLDTDKPSKNLEIYNLREPLKYPPVEPGYLGTTDQSEKTDIQEANSLFHKIIYSCLFVVIVLAIIGSGESFPNPLIFLFILIFMPAMLLYRIIQK